MIRTRKELDFFIKADKLMNTGTYMFNFRQKLSLWLGFSPTLKWICLMRKTHFFKHQDSFLHRLFYYFYKFRFRHYSKKLGFSIGEDVFGYGLVIPHYGTIVVGDTNRIGNFAVLHTGSCITENGVTAGDGLYISTGAVITKKVSLGNNVIIASNSVVNKSCTQNNVLLAGSPAKPVKDTQTWYESDGRDIRVKMVEDLKREYGL